MFFIIPCVDIFEKVDLRVQNFDVPPQEVNNFFLKGPFTRKFLLMYVEAFFSYL